MSPHILVADDHIAMRYTTAFVLRNVGYQVSLARDGEEALSLILKTKKKVDPFDLLLTDVQMPRISGSELIRILKGMGIILPILVVSGTRDEVLEHALSNNGASDFLMKPFDFGALIHRVEALLENRHRERIERLCRHSVGHETGSRLCSGF